VEPTARTPPITIARILKTRGIKGEVVAELHTDFPSRFEGLHEVWLEFPDGRRERFSLEDSWAYRGRRVLRFGGVGSIADATRLVGAWVQVDAAMIVPLPVGTYYDHDLVGCKVRGPGGEFLGTVTDVVRLQGNSLLAVQGPRGEYWIPAVAAICREISLERKEILADLPEGLMDLNQ